jgi:hypothetical protein
LCSNAKREARDEMSLAVKELMDIITEQNKAINCLQNEELIELKRQASQQLAFNKNIIEKLDSFSPRPTVQTYSRVVSSTTKGSDNQINQKVDKNIIIIKPKTEGQSSKQTAHTFKSAIIKEKKQLLVKEIIDSRKGSIVVKCRSDEDTEVLKKLTQKEVKDIEVIKPKRKNPKIRVFGVDSDVKKEEIIDQICRENNDLKNYFTANKSEDIKDNIFIRAVIKRTLNRGRGDKNTRAGAQHINDYIFELTPKVYNIFKNMRSVLIDMRSYYFVNHWSVTRCFKCQRYGHIADNCKDTTDTCGLCAGSHKTNVCAQDQHNCANCRRYNASKFVTKPLPTDHKAFDRSCERYKRMVQMISDKTNYE